MLTRPLAKEAGQNMSEIYDTVRMEGFVDELEKIASSSLGKKALEGLKGYATALAGGPRKNITDEVVGRMGLLSRRKARKAGEQFFGKKPVESLLGVKEWRSAKDNPELRKQIAKVMLARGGTAAALGGAGYAAAKSHKKKDRQRLGLAYRAGGSTHVWAPRWRGEMINHLQMRAFSDELAKIANLSPPVAPHVPPTQGPPPAAQPNQTTPRGMSTLEATKPDKKGLSGGRVPKYTKSHSVPTPGKSEGYQPVASQPAIKS